jgi:nicotinamide mononucleotide transporter
MSLLEIAAVVAAALGVWLMTRRSMAAWPVNLLACGLYAEVFRETKLYSDMLLQGVYVAFCVYGWWHWSRGLREKGTVRVEPLAWQGWLWGWLAGTAGSVLLGYLMAHHTDAALPHIDSALTAFSLVAQWWATRKYLANWMLWIAVDTVYSGVFVYKHLFFTAGLYAFFVFLAVLGLRQWRRAIAEQQGAEVAMPGADASAESNLP